MKFMMMMHAPRAGWKDAGIGTWPPADIRAHIAFMVRFNEELTASGELVDAQGLALPDEARVVRAAPASGEPVVTDGPFPRRRSSWPASGSSTSRAPRGPTQIAARASAAPGKGGVPMNMPIELRQVMSGPPEDL